MPNAIIFRIGADSQPFATEMRKMNAIANNSARSIASSLASGHAAGMSGLIREAITIPREIVEGRGIGRIIGSTSLLITYMHNLFSGTKQATAGLEAQAGVLAFRAQREALLAEKLMNQSKAVAAVKDISLASTQKEIAALERESLAHLANAESLTIERTAMEKDIALKQAEAALAPAAGFGWIGFAVAALAGLAAGAALAYYHYKKVLDLLTTPIGELGVTKINDQLYGVTRIEEAWRDIARSVQEVDDKYNSAAESAHRLAEATELAYRNQVELDEIAKRTELARAKTPAEREAIEKRYSDLAVKRMEEQQKLEKKQREDVIAAMAAEAMKKKKEMDGLGLIQSKEAANKEIENKENQIKAIRDKLAKFGEEPAFYARRQMVYGANGVSTMQPAVESEEHQAWAANQKDLFDNERQLTQMRKQEAANDPKRKRAADLKKEITELETKAEQLDVSGQDTDAKAARALEAFKKKQLAELQLGTAEDSRPHGHGAAHESLNSLQRQGLQRISPATHDIVRATQETARNTRELVSRSRRQSGARQHNPMGNTTFGPH